VSLSDHEKQVWDDLADQLGQSPEIQSAVRATQGRSVRRIVIGAVLGILGLGSMLAGVVTAIPAIGWVGFLAMLAGAMVATQGIQLPLAGMVAARRAPRTGRLPSWVPLLGYVLVAVTVSNAVFARS
jgi:hypothetical protein